MGQYFHLFNIDKSVWATRAYTKPYHGSGKLPEWFYYDEIPNPLLARLIIPDVALPVNPLDGQSFDLVTTNKHSVGIGSLPVELHERIFEGLDDYVDVYCFCITSKYTWTVGVSRLSLLYPAYARQHYGSWSGDRLITTGDYAHDFPAGVLSHREVRLIEDAADSDFAIRGFRRKIPMNTKRKLIVATVDGSNAPADGDIESPYSGLETLANLTIIKSDHKRLMDRLKDSKLHANFAEWTKVMTSVEYPSDVPWILRNLSKKAYVRADTLSKKKNHLGPQGVKYGDMYTLAFALTSRIVWSDFDGVGQNIPYQVLRGPWAGDRFDIVKITALEGESAQWKDETKAVKRELSMLERAADDY